MINILQFFIWDLMLLWFLQTNDVNGAFEATRKSQSAIASAAGTRENGMDGLSSVRTVLDFNFRSVNDLLRLVRISMESISCWHVYNLGKCHQLNRPVYVQTNLNFVLDEVAWSWIVQQCKKHGSSQLHTLVNLYRNWSLFFYGTQLVYFVPHHLDDLVLVWDATEDEPGTAQCL